MSEKLWTLMFDAHIGGHVELTIMPLALCTSINEAKRIAESVSNGGVDWALDEYANDPDYGEIWNGRCSAELEDISNGTVLDVFCWHIWSGALNRILHLDWECMAIEKTLSPDEWAIQKPHFIGLNAPEVFIPAPMPDWFKEL